MAKTQTLKFKRTLNATPEAVYRALTNATALREWLCDTAVAEPRKGGRLYLAWNQGYYAAGEYLKLDPGRKVAFSWQGQGEPGATEVRVSIAEKKSGTVVTLEHRGVGTGKKWAEASEEVARGWVAGLENLQSVLETGQDLRFTLRPMLGITGLNSLSPEDAVRLSVPTQQGVVIDGTVPGMGAEAAGLQKDDVLITIGKHKVSSFPTLAGALQQHRAGDKVTVTYYRGGEKQTAEMELSRRPLPEIPGTAGELAETVRKRYEESNAILAQALEGISAAEADFRPAPGDWTAKEVMAHLIIGERDNHPYVAELVAGEERPYTDFSNSHLRTRGTAEAYPTLEAMMAALRGAQAETVHMLAALPDEFVAGRRSWWRLAFGFLQNDDHTLLHLRQIEAAVAAARHAG
jgi:uncharacterized protein YndB with AHSA1/START domain